MDGEWAAGTWASLLIHVHNHTGSPPSPLFPRHSVRVHCPRPLLHARLPTPLHDLCAHPPTHSTTHPPSNRPIHPPTRTHTHPQAMNACWRLELKNEQSMQRGQLSADLLLVSKFAVAAPRLPRLQVRRRGRVWQHAVPVDDGDVALVMRLCSAVRSLGSSCCAPGCCTEEQCVLRSPPPPPPPPPPPAAAARCPRYLGRHAAAQCLFPICIPGTLFLCSPPAHTYLQGRELYCGTVLTANDQLLEEGGAVVLEQQLRGRHVLVVGSGAAAQDWAEHCRRFAGAAGAVVLLEVQDDEVGWLGGGGGGGWVVVVVVVVGWGSLNSCIW